MKKTIYAIVAMIMLVGTVTFLSCNKESEMPKNEASLSDEKSNMDMHDFTPDFRRRNAISPYALCDSKSGNFCGFNLDNALNGDEVCWLMMHEGDPFRFILPKSLILSSNAGELVDSAHTGAMTFHSDFEIVSAHLAKDLGINLIPAGRYPVAMTMYDGDSAVCIYLDTIL